MLDMFKRKYVQIYNFLYSRLNNCSKSYVTVFRKIAISYLKKVTEQFPEDVEAWIEYAQVRSNR